MYANLPGLPAARVLARRMVLPTSRCTADRGVPLTLRTADRGVPRPDAAPCGMRGTGARNLATDFAKLPAAPAPAPHGLLGDAQARTPLGEPPADILAKPGDVAAVRAARSSRCACSCSACSLQICRPAHQRLSVRCFSRPTAIMACCCSFGAMPVPICMPLLQAVARGQQVKPSVARQLLVCCPISVLAGSITCQRYRHAEFRPDLLLLCSHLLLQSAHVCSRIDVAPHSPQLHSTHTHSEVQAAHGLSSI